MKNSDISFCDILRSSGSWKIKIVKLTDFIFGSVIAALTLPRKRQQINVDNVDSVLIIRPGGIGDAVFVIPLLRVLRESHPGVKIDILCEKRNAAIFRSQDKIVDNIYCYDNLSEFFSFMRKTYDISIDTEQWHYLSALISRLVSRQNIGFDTRYLRAKLFSKCVAYDNNEYELENFKELFKSVITKAFHMESIDSCFSVLDDNIKWAEQEVPDRSISLFLGASISERRLTKSQSKDLIRSILDKNFHVVILGGKDVKKECREVTDEISDNRVLNFSGQVSLERSAALIKQSRIFIGTDSGLMHLACAVGTPVIAIFGPGNLKKWGPKGERHCIVTEKVECSPCTQFGYTVPTCKGKYQCMRDIKIDEISEHLKQL